MGNKGSKKAAQKKIPHECVQGKRTDSENGGYVITMVEEGEMNLGALGSNSQFFLLPFSLFIVSKSLKNQSLAELAVWVILSVYQETTKYLSDYDFTSLMSQKHPGYFLN